MCGIVAACAERDVTPILIEGLRHLEYRGYDSAGVVILDTKNKLQRHRILGKVQKLADLISQHPIPGKIGIAHTRWATHGIPSVLNAHPHISNNTISVVHNGIIENFEALRNELIAKGYQFTSDTDTEVIAHLLHYHSLNEKNFLEVLLQLEKVLEGAYALAIVSNEVPEKIWAIRKGSPLVVGIGIHENFLASDKLALLPVTHRFIYLNEGDIVCISSTTISIWNEKGQAVDRPIHKATLEENTHTKGEFRHFMLKEIFEQPQALERIIKKTFEKNGEFKKEPFGKPANLLLQQAKQIYIVACGTSYNAGLVAKYWFEKIAKVPCHVEIASEFRYRSPVVAADTLLILISQSGETADTLAALRLAKKMNFIGFLTICNVAASSLAHESDATILTLAGPEIGVASTKAFTNQLLILLLCAANLAQLQQQNIDSLLNAVLTLPATIEEVITLTTENIKLLATLFLHMKSTLFLGRGSLYPIAVEGALKLKELSYIHAEAYPAGELKHGPLALVDHNMPIILLAPHNKLLEKTYSNAQEIKAREGKLFIITDDNDRFSKLGPTLLLPTVPEYIEPIVYSIPMQLFAYYVAVLKGTDVDQPRNLAKSVTVE